MNTKKDLQDKWNRRYQDRLPEIRACGVLQQHAAMLPAQGKALDLACGLGGNALFLASKGLHCDAVDFSEVGLNALDKLAREHRLPVTSIQRDIEESGLPENEGYDVIVVSYFLYRPLLRTLASALRPGGLLYYQTFNRRRPACGGPQNPDFLLDEGELPACLPHLLLRFEDEDFLGSPNRPAETAIVLQKPCD